MNQYDTFVLPIHPSSFNHGYQTTADKGAWFQTIQEMSTEDLDTFNLLCHNNQGLMDNAQIRFILSELLRRKASMINTEASLPQSGSKRKAEDEYAACADCKGEFLLCDGTTNNQELCYFHHGEQVTQWEYWPNIGLLAHGPIDTEENKKNWPQNFRWTCCGRAGNEQGCAVGRHSLRKKVPGEFRACKWVESDEEDANATDEETVGEHEDDDEMMQDGSDEDDGEASDEESDEEDSDNESTSEHVAGNQIEVEMNEDSARRAVATLQRLIQEGRLSLSVE